MRVVLYFMTVRNVDIVFLLIIDPDVMLFFLQYMFRVRHFIRQLIVRGQVKFSSENQNEKIQGTQYTSWVLARAASHNHNVQHMKRKFLKDRFSIHKLTNILFLTHLVRFEHKYNLKMNENILLLAQFNHILEILGKNKAIYQELVELQIRIIKNIQNPDDLPCLGTFMSSLISIQNYSQDSWQFLMDTLIARKYDQEYDELFGIIISLQKYRKHIVMYHDYLTIRADPIIPKIPIIYRNSLEVLRQYITYNLFNLKECRLLFEALYQANINEGYFWTSVKDWFNIFVKEQLNQKQMDQFFIMNQGAIDKILHDHGKIRPRPILQQLTHIAFILSQFGHTSWRFIEFSQDLVLFSMDNGSKLYQRFQSLSEDESQKSIKLNQHMKYDRDSEKQKVDELEKNYRTIFVNPIDLKNQSIAYFLMILARAYTPNKQEDEKREQRQRQIFFDQRVLKWVLMRLVKPKMQYTIPELLQIKNCEVFLREQCKFTMQGFLYEKLKSLRDFECSLAELEQLMNFLPVEHFPVIIPVVKYFLNRHHPSQVLKLTKMIESKEWIPRLLEAFLQIPKIVNLHEKYFSFEENCYFLYLLLKSSQYYENYSGNIQEFEGEMEKLKESIKIITYSRGFKLSIDSYFHKIMNYIDVVEFFEGGTT